MLVAAKSMFPTEYGNSSYSFTQNFPQVLPSSPSKILLENSSEIMAQLEAIILIYRKLYLEIWQLRELRFPSENRKLLHGLNKAIDELKLVVGKCFPDSLSVSSGGALAKILYNNIDQWRMGVIAQF